MSVSIGTHASYNSIYADCRLERFETERQHELLQVVAPWARPISSTIRNYPDCAIAGLGSRQYDCVCWNFGAVYKIVFWRVGARNPAGICAFGWYFVAINCGYVPAEAAAASVDRSPVIAKTEKSELIQWSPSNKTDTSAYSLAGTAFGPKR